MFEEQSDAWLVERARADDVLAFNALIERYRALLFCIVLRYTANEDIASELVQESLLQAYLSLDRLHDETRFKSWLFGITLNVCRSWRRDDKTQCISLETLMAADTARDLPATDFLADPQELIEERELQHMVRDAVALLSPKNREVAQLFYYADFSLQDIARQLDISVAAVKSRLFKGREQLRVWMVERYPELVRTMSSNNREGRISHMIAVKVAKVLPLEKHGRVIVVLVDEQRQRALPLWYSTLQVSMAQRLTGGIAEPLTTDFVRHILEALGGTVDEIAIDTLQDDILYARVQLHGPDRLQTTRTIKARLDDALPLAVQLQCPLVVADHLLEQRGIMLAGKGETFEQQIEAVAQLAKNMPLPFGREAKPVVFAAIPRNLDFREGLQSWSVTGIPVDTERAEMQLDPVHQYDGRPSLQIVLRGVEPSPDRVLPQAMAMLKHEGFLADSYRGQRLRTVIYAKSEAVKQAIFHLTVTQPASEQSDVPTVRHMTNSRQHPIEGTSDWTRYELVIDAPPDAATIEFSCHLVGSGTLWLAGLRFETVEKGLPLTGTDIMPPPQKPLNLDFAQGLAYWTLNGRFVQDYAALVDDKTRFQGQVSATLKAIAKDPRGVGSLYQTLNAFNYHGKRVRVNGMIKTQDVEQGAGLYLGSSTANGERSEHLIQGTNDWTPFEVELDIPEGEFFIRFGIMLRGKGQIWLAAVHLDPVVVPESAG